MAAAGGGAGLPAARPHVLGWLAAGRCWSTTRPCASAITLILRRDRANFARPSSHRSAVTAAAVQGGLSSLREVMTGTAFDGTGQAARTGFWPGTTTWAIPRFCEPTNALLPHPARASGISALASRRRRDDVRVIADGRPRPWQSGDPGRVVRRGRGPSRRFAVVPGPGARELVVAASTARICLPMAKAGGLGLSTPPAPVAGLNCRVGLPDPA